MVLLVLLVCLCRAPRVCKAPLDLPEEQVPQVLQVPPVHKVLVGLREAAVLKERRVSPEPQVSQASRDRKESRALQDSPGPLVYLVDLV